MKTWTDYLQEMHSDVYDRLCNCRNTKDDIRILVRWKYAVKKENNPRYTKEDALVSILELLDSNGQYQLCDLTKEEYKDLAS